MNLNDLIKNLQAKHPDLRKQEIEGIIVVKSSGNIIALVAELPAADMQKLVEMFDK